MTPEEITLAVAEYASDGKAEEIVELDLRGLTSVADYFVICTGRSDRQVKAIHDTGAIDGQLQGVNGDAATLVAAVRFGSRPVEGLDVVPRHGQGLSQISREGEENWLVRHARAATLPQRRDRVRQRIGDRRLIDCARQQRDDGRAEAEKQQQEQYTEPDEGRLENLHADAQQVRGVVQRNGADGLHAFAERDVA